MSLRIILVFIYFQVAARLQSEAIRGDPRQFEVIGFVGQVAAPPHTFDDEKACEAYLARRKAKRFIRRDGKYKKKNTLQVQQVSDGRTAKGNTSAWPLNCSAGRSWLTGNMPR